MTEIVMGGSILLIGYAIYMYPAFLMWVLDRVGRDKSGRIE